MQDLSNFWSNERWMPTYIANKNVFHSCHFFCGTTFTHPFQEKFTDPQIRLLYCDTNNVRNCRHDQFSVCCDIKDWACYDSTTEKVLYNDLCKKHNVFPGPKSLQLLEIFCLLK